MGSLYFEYFCRYEVGYNILTKYLNKVDFWLLSQCNKALNLFYKKYRKGINISDILKCGYFWLLYYLEETGKITMIDYMFNENVLCTPFCIYDYYYQNIILEKSVFRGERMYLFYVKMGNINLMKSVSKYKQLDYLNVCAIAARFGQFDTLKWARANGYPWSELTSICAVKSGNKEMIKWARENGCPWAPGLPTD